MEMNNEHAENHGPNNSIVTNYKLISPKESQTLKVSHQTMILILVVSDSGFTVDLEV